METPRKFITAKLSICKPGSSSLPIRNHNISTIIIISTDEDPGLRIESFAVINLRGVSTNKKYDVFYRHANLYKELSLEVIKLSSKNKVFYLDLFVINNKKLKMPMKLSNLRHS